jgi:hypothetical protein
LGAAPVILTLSSKPVLAGQCTTASAAMSANASRPSSTKRNCAGKSPAYWQSESTYSQWPGNTVAIGTTSTTQASTSGQTGAQQAEAQKASSKSKATLFGEVFAGKSAFSDMTLLAVLKTTSTGDADVARHLVAAYFNALQGTTAGVLDVGTVMDIWSSYRRFKYYKPAGDVIWYYDRSVPAGNGSLIEWLQTTMT